MHAMQAALWGLLGGGVAEALAFHKLMHGPDGEWRWPWRSRADRPVIMAATSLRVFASVGLPLPLSVSHQLPTPMAAFIAGVAAPLTVMRMFEAVPVAEAPPASRAVDLTAVESRDREGSA